MLSSIYYSSVFLVSNIFDITPPGAGTPGYIVLNFFAWIMGWIVWAVGAYTVYALFKEVIKHQQADPRERPGIRSEMVKVVGVPAAALFILYYADSYLDQLVALV